MRLPRTGRAPAAPQSDEATAWPVNIGAAAALTGVSARMIRHYESLGLLGAVSRTDSGYRLYSQADVHSLRFIRRARDLGFEMDEIAQLLGLWHNSRRTSASVRRMAQRHSDELMQRIEAMQSMKRTLDHLIHCCAGDDRPDCPILDDLASSGSPVNSSGRGAHAHR